MNTSLFTRYKNFVNALLIEELNYPKELAERIHIPESQGENPFKIDAYTFGSELNVNDCHFSGPFLINKNVWPEMYHKALIVSSGMVPEIVERGNNYFIILKADK